MQADNHDTNTAVKYNANTADNHKPNTVVKHNTNTAMHCGGPGVGPRAGTLLYHS